jgi:hypothetical protein
VIGILLGLLGFTLSIELWVASRRHKVIVALLKEIKTELAQVRLQTELQQLDQNGPASQS